jgi:hypothetical protein
MLVAVELGKHMHKATSVEMVLDGAVMMVPENLMAFVDEVK